ncbi:hypothetical protein DPMN_160968 [Dreissena polymorpha]|uniref:Uncharacterized protein n=1 Tax=Dreissena polymorpha TaxID=45954 RepID=A0A9D4ER93_DREPO|nr:hypothetical protein DPMN_160968 [Dreissena polymorpha]
MQQTYYEIPIPNKGWFIHSYIHHPYTATHPQRWNSLHTQKGQKTARLLASIKTACPWQPCLSTPKPFSNCTGYHLNKCFEQQDIIGTNVRAQCYDELTINVASRILTSL